MPACAQRLAGTPSAPIAKALERREEVWTLGTIVAQAATRDETPRGQLLAIFDIFDEWFHAPDYEGDPFITVLLEMGPDHDLGRAALEHLDNVRATIRSWSPRTGPSRVTTQVG